MHGIAVLLAALAQETPWQDLPSGDSRGQPIRASISLADPAKVHKQDAEFQVSQYDLGVSIPVWGNAEDAFTVFASMRHLELDTRMVLPDTGERFPDDLWNIQGGVGYRHRYDGGQILGGRVSIGSASDEPFNGSREVAIGGFGFLRLPAGERDSWFFFLAFSNNRSYLNYVPIPGIAYGWRPSDEFQATIGLPFVSAQWRPVKELSFNVSAAPIHNIRVGGSWTPLEELRFEVAGHWATQSWLRADRPDRRDRLFYDEKQVTAGLRWLGTPHLTVSAGVGYSFGRRWSEGESLTDEDAFNKIEIGPGAFVSVGLTISLGAPAEGESKPKSSP